MKSTVLLFKGNILKFKKKIDGLSEILCISFSSSFDKNHIYLSIPNKIKILNCDLDKFTIEVSQNEIVEEGLRNFIQITKDIIAIIKNHSYYSYITIWRKKNEDKMIYLKEKTIEPKNKSLISDLCLINNENFVF